MANSILRMVLGWPFWAYFLLAAGVFWANEQLHKGTLQQEAEKVVALQQAAPASVDLAQFTLEANRGPAQEVNVIGWINTDYNYNLIKRTNGIKTGERFMWALFGASEDGTSETVRAAMVMTKAEKERFVEDPARFMTGFSTQGELVMTLNGFGFTSHSFSGLVSDSLRKEGLRKSPNFIYLEPFLDGREAALQPATLPGKDRYLGWAVAAALVLMGVAKLKIRSGTASKPVTAGTAVRNGTDMDAIIQRYEVPKADQMATLASHVDDDSPIARMRRKAQAGKTPPVHAADDFADSPILSKGDTGWHAPKQAEPPKVLSALARIPTWALYAALILSVSLVVGAIAGAWAIMPVLLIGGANLVFFLLARSLGQVVKGLFSMIGLGAAGKDPFDRLAQQARGGPM